MAIVLHVVVVFCFISFTQNPVQCCPDETVLKLLKDNLFPADVISILKGKEFVDIWGEKSFADRWDCALNEYNWDDTTNSLKVKMFVERGQTTHVYNEVWVPDKQSGVLLATGDTDGHTYTYPVFFVYADDDVVGYYTCDSKPLANRVGRLVISMVLNKMDDNEALQSLEKAEVKINELKTVTGDVMERVSPKVFINGV